MTREELNELPAEEAQSEFLKCCGSRTWAKSMTDSRPFATREQVFAAEDKISSSLTEEDWLEAFRAHPKIGEKKAATAQTQQEQRWSSQEQAAMQSATADTLARLASQNREYERKFGFIFIVCATGKSSADMLSMLERRLENDPQTELSIAAHEQQKITRLRLEKLLSQ